MWREPTDRWRADELAAVVRQGALRAVLFDFDGTLSRLRAGWPQVMTDVLWEYWQAAGLSSAEPDLQRQQLLHLVLATNGMPPLRQMQAFTELVRLHGGAVLDAAECTAAYQCRLMAVVEQRYAAIRRGDSAPEHWRVPGAKQMLAVLQQRNWLMFLVSGTDYEQVCMEAELLELAPFFSPHRLFAPQPSDPQFAKERVIARILQEHGLCGQQLLGFGDGVVETREVKRIGGVAIGLATSESIEAIPLPEPQGHGPSDPTVADKYHRLQAAGADLIVPDFRPLLGVFAGM